MKKNKKSDILETVYSSVKDLHDAGAVSNITMKEFEQLCLEPPAKFDSNRIKKIRKKECFSQAVFAKFLNVSPSTVKQWELGEKKPSGWCCNCYALIYS